MKKFLKLIIINFLILILVILTLECICFLFNYYKRYKGDAYLNFPIKKHIAYSFNMTYDRFYHEHGYMTLEQFRPTPHQYNKNNISIVLLGCSFTYGENIRFEETFGSQLAKYTNFNVYNLGLPGGSPKEMLYILRNKDLLNQLVPNNSNVKYVIYTYINGHHDRLFVNTRLCTPHFTETKNHNLIHRKSLFERNFSALYETILEFKVSHMSYHKKEQKFLIYMKNIYNEILKDFNNNGNNDVKPQLVIFVYSENNNIDWSELEKYGIIVIKAKDIIDINLQSPEYVCIDGYHPNAKAWAVIVPALAKELNL